MELKLVTMGKLIVPNNPIIPYIIGDGIGIDVTPVMKRVLDYAVNKAYDNKREIKWLELFAGSNSNDLYGSILPDETLSAMKEYRISIKGLSQRQLEQAINLST